MYSLLNNCSDILLLASILVNSNLEGLIAHRISVVLKWSQEDGGTGQGDHFLPHKFIKRSFECWATSTKQLLNAGGGHQAPRNAAYSLWKEVGQNTKDTKRDKRVRDRDPSWGGGCGGEVSKQ